MGTESTTTPDAGDLLEELLADDSAPPSPAPPSADAQDQPPRQEGPVSAWDEDGDDEDALDAEDPGGPVEYWLRPSKDNVRILLDCPDPAGTPDKWAVRIYADLEAMELPEIPDRETVKEILKKIAVPGRDLQKHPLIMGTPAIPPRSAEMHWSRPYFAEGWLVNEATDQIDFREKVENCAVHRNELLLRLYHEMEGEPGQDIFGNKIPVEKPEKLRVRCGKGVTQVDEGPSTAFYSDLDGRVRFTDSTLAVDEVYQVTGDVGLATGNIHHTGSVTISGDVLAGSVLEADGDIVVKGMVEAATITCGGSLTVAGGILGGEGHTIRALCDVEAKYIREADVTADGDILVTKEITHSQVHCRGAILVPNGRIAGGEVVALRGVRCATAGAPGATRTVIKSGIDFSMKAQMELYYEKIDRLESLLKPVTNALANIENHTGEELSEAEKQVVENLALKRMNLQEAVSIMYMRVTSLMEQVKEQAVLHVVMFKEVWSNTTIWLGENSTFVKRSIDKPRVALMRGDRARILPLGEDNLPPESNHPRCPKK